MQAANPVDQDPISKAWFQRQLQQYPAVRSRDYVGPQVSTRSRLYHILLGLTLSTHTFVFV